MILTSSWAVFLVKFDVFLMMFNIYCNDFRPWSFVMLIIFDVLATFFHSKKDQTIRTTMEGFVGGWVE